MEHTDKVILKEWKIHFNKKMYERKDCIMKNCNWEQNRYYRRAYQYGNEEIRNKLQEFLQKSNEQRQKQQILEEKYCQAGENTRRQQYKAAMELYEEIGDYKDSLSQKAICLKNMGLQSYRKEIGDVKGYLYRCVTEKKTEEWNEYQVILKKLEECSNHSWAELMVKLMVCIFIIINNIILVISTGQTWLFPNMSYSGDVNVMINFILLFFSLIIMSLETDNKKNMWKWIVLSFSLLIGMLFFVSSQWIYWIICTALEIVMTIILIPIEDIKLLRNQKRFQKEQEYYENEIIKPFEDKVREDITNLYVNWIGTENLVYLESSILYAKSENPVQNLGNQIKTNIIKQNKSQQKSYMNMDIKEKNRKW